MKKENKGFTIAELLTVVAIIGVLVAVSIPIFTAQLAKARLATNQANIRAAKTAVSADYLTYEDGKYAVYAFEIKSGSLVEIPKGTGTTTYGNLIDNNHNGICIIDCSKDKMTNAGGVIFNRLMNPYWQTFDEIYPYVVVYISPDGIVTCPYYNSSSNAISADTFK